MGALSGDSSRQMGYILSAGAGRLGFRHDCHKSEPYHLPDHRTENSKSLSRAGLSSMCVSFIVRKKNPHKNKI